MESSPKNSGLESWFERCSELCSSLTNQGCKFSFSLKLEGSFSFSLQSENAVLPRTKKRFSPSYMRRQQRRRADLLKKRSGLSPAEKAAGNQQEEAAAVDTSSPLNLCPKPVYPLLMDIPESEESEDDYDEEEGQAAPLSEAERAAMEADKIRQGDRKGYDQCFRTGYAKQGSNCEECQQIIVDKRLRYYPALCESCSGYTPELDTFFRYGSDIAPVTTSLSKPAY